MPFLEIASSQEILTKPRYLGALEKTGFAPAEHCALPSLKAVLSTGSPLAPGSFDGSYEAFLSCVHPDDREAIGRIVAAMPSDVRAYKDLADRILVVAYPKIDTVARRSLRSGCVGYDTDHRRLTTAQISARSLRRFERDQHAFDKRPL